MFSKTGRCTGLSSWNWKIVAVMPDPIVIVANTRPRPIASWWGFRRDFTSRTYLAVFQVSKFSQYRLGVGPRWPWYFEPSSVAP